MRAGVRWPATLALIATSSPASAHVVFGMTGFSGGLLHPLLVPSHAMTALALGMLISQQGWSFGIPAIYAIAIGAGLGTIALGTVPLLAEETLLTAVAAIGLLVTSGWRVLWMVGAGLAAIAGFALALDSPPEAISLAEANWMLVGTALSATGLLAVLAYLASQMRRHWQHIGMRIVGSWIAASAILVLALRVLR